MSRTGGPSLTRRKHGLGTVGRREEAGEEEGRGDRARPARGPYARDAAPLPASQGAYAPGRAGHQDGPECRLRAQCFLGSRRRL